MPRLPWVHYLDLDPATTAALGQPMLDLLCEIQQAWDPRVTDAQAQVARWEQVRLRLFAFLTTWAAGTLTSSALTPGCLLCGERQFTCATCAAEVTAVWVHPGTEYTEQEPPPLSPAIVRERQQRQAVLDALRAEWERGVNDGEMYRRALQLYGLEPGARRET
jgi:hypothetical protein